MLDQPVMREWRSGAAATLAISVPATFTVFAQTLNVLVETIFVAQLGTQALASLGLATSIYSFTFLFTLGMVEAVGVFVSRSLSEGSQPKAINFVFQSIIIALGAASAGILMLALGLGLSYRTVSDPSVRHGIALYLAGSGIGLPFWLVYVALRSAAVASGHPRIPLFFMLCSIPIHAVLSYALINGVFGYLALGVLGAGLASSLSIIFVVIFLWRYLSLSPSSPFCGLFKKGLATDFFSIREILSLGVPLAFRVVLRKGMMPVATMIVAPFGAEALTLHIVAMRLLDVASVLSFGFSSAASIRVSSALGLDKIANARLAGIQAVQLSTIAQLIFGLMVLLIPHYSLSALASVESSSMGIQSLLPLAVVLSVSDGIQTACSGALSGVRDAKVPLMISLVSVWGFGLPLSYILGHNFESHTLGVWIGLMLASSLAAMLYLRRFLMLTGGGIKTPF